MKRGLILGVIAKYRYSIAQYVHDAYLYSEKKLSIRRLKNVRHEIYRRDEVEDECVVNYTLDLLAGRTTPIGRDYDKR